MLTPRETCDAWERKRQPLTFCRKTRSFFTTGSDALADENFKRRPANGRATVDRADERVICKDFSRLGMGCTQGAE
jgi:hypothetical protein